MYVCIMCTFIYIYILCIHDYDSLTTTTTSKWHNIGNVEQRIFYIVYRRRYTSGSKPADDLYVLVRMYTYAA